MTETWELPATTAAAITAEAARETMSFAHGILLRLVLCSKRSRAAEVPPMQARGRSAAVAGRAGCRPLSREA